jgi:hypothetical protein
MSLPFLRIIDSTSPESIEHVQKTNFSNYVKGWRTFEILKDAFGEGIFGVDGERVSFLVSHLCPWLTSLPKLQWVRQRKATAKIFTNANFKSIISDSLHLDLENLRECFNTYADSGEAFDLSNVFFAFTLSSFVRMAFGLELGVIAKGGVATVPFGELVLPSPDL